MSGYSSRFAGQGVQPARVPYAYLAMSTSVALQWPPLVSGAETGLADIMDVVPVLSGLTLTLPNAQEGSAGASVLLVNKGNFSVSLANYQGASVADLGPGQAKFLYLASNDDTAGDWKVVLFGVGVANVDIVGAAGAGLVAQASQLAIGRVVSQVNASRAVGADDRAKVLVWVGGSGTLTLPTTSAVAPFNFDVRNQGSGSLVLATTGGEDIDGSSTITLGVGEAATVNAGNAEWYTVGRGRLAAFNFSLLVKDVTGSGGAIDLSLTEAANVVQQYEGTLAEDTEVFLPGVVQVYYISNRTSGAYDLTFRTAGTGDIVTVPTGQAAVLFCDGLNVYNNSTTIAGISSIVFAAGSAAATPVGLGTSDNGLFSPGSDQVGVSAGGTHVVTFDQSGLQVVAPIAPRALVGALAGNAAVQVSRPAGSKGTVDLLTGAQLRWQVGASAAPETGSNAGSNLEVSRYNDAGALIDVPARFDRATGYLVIKGVRDLSRVGQLAISTGPASQVPAFTTPADGQLRLRADFPELFAWASAGGLVSENDWQNNGYSGRYSVGDGSTTFRVPRIADGSFIRPLDTVGLYDPGRAWGTWQDQAVPVHGHAITDPGHGHGVTDPTHTHVVDDPGHAHAGSTSGVGDHQHSYTRAQVSGVGTGVGGAIGLLVDGNVGDATAGAGAHSHSISTDGRFTGVTNVGSATGVSINSGTTGISVANAGAADGHSRNYAYPVFIYY